MMLSIQHSAWNGENPTSIWLNERDEIKQILLAICLGHQTSRKKLPASHFVQIDADTVFPHVNIDKPSIFVSTLATQ